MRPSTLLRTGTASGTIRIDSAGRTGDDPGRPVVLILNDRFLSSRVLTAVCQTQQDGPIDAVDRDSRLSMHDDESFARLRHAAIAVVSGRREARARRAAAPRCKCDDKMLFDFATVLSSLIHTVRGL